MQPRTDRSSFGIERRVENGRGMQLGEVRYLLPSDCVPMVRVLERSLFHRRRQTFVDVHGTVDRAEVVVQRDELALQVGLSFDN